MKINTFDQREMTAHDNSSARPATENRSPDADDTARFQRLATGKEREARERDRKDVPSESSPSPLLGFGQFLNPDALLQGMKSAIEHPSPASELPSGSSVEDMAVDIAQRILVSDSELGSGREVRIQLKDSILPGTEIRIARDAYGVHVELNSVDDGSLAFLQDNRDGLLRHLQNRMEEPVSVEVRMDSPGGDRDESQGRSRQQRDLYEEYEDFKR